MAKVDIKKPIIDEISELLNGAQSAVLVDYRGITVEEDTKLRKALREAGVIYKVYKNTMVNFAVKDTEFECLSKHLEGPTAIAVSKDNATIAAKIIVDFAEEAEALEVKAGVVEGSYYDADGMKVIAKIPSREELLSKLLGSIQSPIANFARVVKQIADSKEEAA